MQRIRRPAASHLNTCPMNLDDAEFLERAAISFLVNFFDYVLDVP
jgi:hypothetical protein